VLRVDEDVDNGIQAKNPNAGFRLSSFIRTGTRMRNGSQFIATTASFATAFRWAVEDVEKRNVPLEKVRIAVIDIDALSNCECQILDMSTRDAGTEVFASRSDERMVSKKYQDIALNFTVKSCEVDIVGIIPTDTFRIYYLSDFKAAVENAMLLSSC
jgi:predicted P-loop ATPase/GTPase